MLKKIDCQKWKMRLVYLICFLFFLGGSWAIFDSYSNVDETISDDELFKNRLVLIASTLFFTGCGLFLYFLNKENNKENRFISKYANPIIIRSSYSKNLLLLFSCMLFVVICTPLTLYPDSFDFGNRYEKIIIGTLGLIFFGFMLIINFLKLFNNNSSLEINDRGFVINSGVLKSKDFFWKDIKSVNETIIRNNKFISITFNNPKEYFNQKKAWIVRKYYYAIYARDNSLICLTSSNFDIGHNQLIELLVFKLNQYREKN